MLSSHHYNEIKQGQVWTVPSNQISNEHGQQDLDIMQQCIYVYDKYTAQMNKTQQCQDQQSKCTKTGIQVVLPSSRIYMREDQQQVVNAWQVQHNVTRQKSEGSVI